MLWQRVFCVEQRNLASIRSHWLRCFFTSLHDGFRFCMSKIIGGCYLRFAFFDAAMLPQSLLKSRLCCSLEIDYKEAGCLHLRQFTELK